MKKQKMKVDPEMCMKTKGRTTECPIYCRAFVPGLSLFCRIFRILGANLSQFAALRRIIWPEYAFYRHIDSQFRKGEGL